MQGTNLDLVTAKAGSYMRGFSMKNTVIESPDSSRRNFLLPCPLALYFRFGCKDNLASGKRELCTFSTVYHAPPYMNKSVRDGSLGTRWLKQVEMPSSGNLFSGLEPGRKELRTACQQLDSASQHGYI